MVSLLCLVNMTLKMIRPFVPLVVTLLLLFAKEAQMNGLHERSHFLSATVGDNITLSCLFKEMSKITTRLYWYKQSLGLKPTIVSAHSKFHKLHRLYGEFNSSKRFTLGHENNHLQMKDVQVSDSAVYLCMSCFLHQISVLKSFTVVVQSLEAEVHQPPHKDADEGQSVILNCYVHIGSCGEQARVHWFKQSEESTPGVLYSHGGGSSDHCERNPTNSCVYSLHIHHLSSAQTGTYYCAVAACGEVRFGNGATVRIRDGSYMTYFLSGALVFSLVLLLVLVFSLNRIKKKYQNLSTEFDCQCGSSAVNNGVGQDQECESLNYTALNIHPVSRRQRVRERTDCVYSSVQQN